MNDEQLEDVMPSKIRRALRAAVAPLAILIALLAIGWYVSDMFATVSVENDMVKRVEGAEPIKGVVLSNARRDVMFGRSGTLVVLGDGETIFRIPYGSVNDAQCVGDVEKSAHSLEEGDYIKAYGKPSGGWFDVCSNRNFYITNLSEKRSPYVGWRAFEGSRFGFEFPYPRSWSASTTPADSSGTSDTLTLYDASGAARITVSLFIAPDFGPDEWLTKYFAQRSTTTPAIGTFVFGGKRAVTAVVPGPGGDRRVVALSHRSRIVQIEYAASAEDTTTLEKLVLDAFEFPRSEEEVVKDIVATSGIEGRVTMGPVCPVVRVQDADSCADRPFSADLRIIGADGFVRTASSDANGKLLVRLAPGVYVIENASEQSMPSLRPFQVVVEAGKFTAVDIAFDSGIR